MSNNNKQQTTYVCPKHNSLTLDHPYSESESPERRKKIKGKKDKSTDGESGIEEGEGHKKIKKKKANKGLAKILASPNPSKSPKNSPRFVCTEGWT